MRSIQAAGRWHPAQPDTLGVRRLLAEVSEVSMDLSPKEQFIRESMRIKTEMIKELVWERDSLEFRISSMQLEIDKLKAELAKLTK